MGYVDKNLMSGEVVLYEAKISWVNYLPSIFLFIVGILLIRLYSTIGYVIIIISVFNFLVAFITRWTTELVVTSKRVIHKTGLISRKTIELNHSKVESYYVEQSVLGRIFDFGTIIIHGTGGGKNPIRDVDSPLMFRNKAMEIIDTYQTR